MRVAPLYSCIWLPETYAEPKAHWMALLSYNLIASTEAGRWSDVMAGIQESAACQAALVVSYDIRRKSSRIGYAAGISPEYLKCYLRSMCFAGDFAIVDLTKPRENKTFTGLALDDDLAKADSEPRCAQFVIDLKTGDIVHWLRIEDVVEELYDVVALPGVVRPMAIGFKTDEIRRTINVGEESPLYAN